ncbi:MAG: hypothetical protein K2P17_03000 [Helicobacteraceae bacterium]|nr:hypothetical protein [Helicobacteraceae bacterium]
MQSNNKDRLLAQLKNHGIEKVDNLSEVSILEKLKEATIEWTKNMVAYNTETKAISAKNLESMDIEIKNIILKNNDFYTMFNELLANYPLDNIRDIVINSIAPKLLDKSLNILDIKYRQYQEIIIETIEKKLNFMPEEERATFMNFIEKNRDEIELLKGFLNQLENTKIADNINRISNIKKYIISSFLPDELEKNYKYFFNHSKDKQELIKRLREISNAYSKEQLDDMTKEDLIDILNSIKQKELNDKKDKDDFNKYYELFKKALYNDSQTFDRLVIQVLEDVSDDCLNNLKAKLKNEDSMFESRFQNAQKEWSQIIKK